MKVLVSGSCFWVISIKKFKTELRYFTVKKCRNVRSLRNPLPSKTIFLCLGGKFSPSQSIQIHTRSNPMKVKNYKQLGPVCECDLKKCDLKT